MVTEYLRKGPEVNKLRDIWNVTHAFHFYFCYFLLQTLSQSFISIALFFWCQSINSIFQCTWCLLSEVLCEGTKSCLFKLLHNTIDFINVKSSFRRIFNKCLNLGSWHFNYFKKFTFSFLKLVNNAVLCIQNLASPIFSGSKSLIFILKLCQFSQMAFHL